MNNDPRSLYGEMLRGKNNYMGVPGAPGAGRPPETGGLRLDLEHLRRKMVQNAAKYSL